MSRSVTLVVPGSIEARTGGSIYDRRIAEGLRAAGWAVAVIELDPITDPLRPPLDTARPRLAAIPDHSTVLWDGLAFGTMPELVEQHGRRLACIPIVHMALGATPGLLPGERGWVTNLERRALVHARQVVITGRPTLSYIRSIPGFRDERVAFIPPGTDRSPIPSRLTAPPLRILCVANLTPGKGHDRLLRALARVSTRDWTLVCAGSLTRDLGHAGRVSLLARELGIEAHVHLAGELDDTDLAVEYARADLFALATRGETYGMAVAEAIAHGLPVVSTLTGEIPAIVGDGGLLAAVDDEDALATHLTRAIERHDVLAGLARGARDAARHLPTWEDATAQFVHVLDAFG